MAAVRTLTGTVRIGTSLTSPSATLTTASISLITGSIRVTGTITGSLAGTSSWASNALTASLAPNYLLLTSTSSMLSPYTLTAQTSSFILTSSFNSYTASVNTSITSLNNATSSYVLTSVTSSMRVATSSLALTASVAPNYVLTSTTSSMSVLSSSFASSVGILNQAVTINGNLTVTGTASFTYTTASQFNLGDNVIILNSSDAARFAGMSVYDSGSTATTASIFWDSENHRWIYQNGYSGSTYTGGILIMGPRNTGSLGSEQGTTNNRIMKGQGGDHITSSAITENGTTTTFYGGVTVNSTTVTATTFSGNLSGTFENVSIGSIAQVDQQNIFTQQNTFQESTYYRVDDYKAVHKAIGPTICSNGITTELFSIYDFIGYTADASFENATAIFTYNLLDIDTAKSIRGGQAIMVWSPDRQGFTSIIDTAAPVYGGDVVLGITDSYDLGLERVVLTVLNSTGADVYIRGLLTIV
jgi:hypothetical protein